MNCLWVDYNIILIDDMPTDSVGIIRRDEICRQSFSSNGPPSPKETKFSDCGFRREGVRNGIWDITCDICNVKVPVEYRLERSRSDIVNLHNYNCVYANPDLEYIKQRAIIINSRRDRGVDRIDGKLIDEFLSKGFQKDAIQRSITEFFNFYGAFPERCDLEEYLRQ